jgi:hypothetical protein
MQDNKVLKVKVVSLQEMADIADTLVARFARRQVVDVGDRRITIFRDWESADHQVAFVTSTNGDAMMFTGKKVSLSPDSLIEVTI